MNILSIQSHVAFGHVGNAAAVFPLQRLGFEVVAVNTVQFSNHTGYGAWTGQVFAPEHIAEVLEGVEARHGLDECGAVLSGYMGDAAIGEAILGAVARVRGRGDALYCCDPVMGDVGRGVFVRPGIPEFMAARAVPAADIVTPNQFELELLTGRPAHTLAEIIAAAASLRGLGPRIVVVTSVMRADAPAEVIETLCATDEGAWLVRTPLLPLEPAPNGAGDAVAALFLGHFLRLRDPAEALSLAVSGLYGVLDRTRQSGRREIQLVAAQDELVTPSRLFSAERVG